MVVKLLFEFVEGELAGLFAIFMATHAVGHQQIEETFLRRIDGNVCHLVAEDEATYRQRILVIVAHKSLVAQGINFDFHSTVNSRVAILTLLPLAMATGVPGAKRAPLTYVPLVVPLSVMVHPLAVLAITPWLLET